MGWMIASSPSPKPETTQIRLVGGDEDIRAERAVFAVACALARKGIAPREIAGVFINRVGRFRIHSRKEVLG